MVATLIYSAMALRTVQPVGDAILAKIDQRQPAPSPTMAKADRRP